MVTTTRGDLAPNVTRALLEDLSGMVSAPRDRPSIGVVAPFTEDEIGAVPESTHEDVRDAVARARVAQETWSRTPMRERARILTRFHDLLIDRADVAMDIVQLEGGKARIPAFEEVYDCCGGEEGRCRFPG
jgi:acyl-CoA reductase-like NAD-dependent aldehyde dehydrogenase